jgi:hypothetical protein
VLELRGLLEDIWCSVSQEQGLRGKGLYLRQGHGQNAPAGTADSMCDVIGLLSCHFGFLYEKESLTPLFLGYH